MKSCENTYANFPCLSVESSVCMQLWETYPQTNGHHDCFPVLWPVLRPLLISVAHDGCFQCPMESFDHTVGCWMVSGCPGELYTIHSGQGTEEL
jgi:hypothetical protein